jgi:epoxyqueuosine reductase
MESSSSGTKEALHTSALDRHQLAAGIKQFARGRLGFDLVGIAAAEPSAHREHFRKWLDDGKAGAMDYLARRFDERVDPSAYLPGAKTAVCVALNYHAKLDPVSAEDQGHHARIARYALGDDYHELIKNRLYDLADWIREQVPGSRTRCGVDTVPVMERELAARAGIGWVGKNTCVINPEIGSWILLGEVLTTIDLPVDDPVADACGSCTRCIDACPTGAITEPYQLDARRCISYLTIEQTDPIPAEYHQPLGEWLYGCDICQDVCPHNHKAPETADDALRPRFKTGTMDLRTLLRWDEPDWREYLRGSAMKRVKLPVLQRNARIVERNQIATGTQRSQRNT